jgi:hypothetical protein
MVTRIGDKREHEIMEITHVSADGNATYAERTISGYAWSCDGCGLIWEKRWHAEGCAERSHAPSFAQHYGGYTENGQHKGGTSYTRQAIGKVKEEETR